MHQFLDKRQITKKNKTIEKIVVLVLFIVLCGLGFLTITGKFFNFIGRPILEAKNSIISGIDNISYYFQSKESLLFENRRLTEENTIMKLQMINYKILEDENNELKETLDCLPDNKNFVLGNILAKPSNSPYDTIIIDIGEGDDIKQGDIVYAGGEIPIGFIDKVYNKTSLVTLYTSPSQKTEGFINGSNASVELIGRGGSNFEMIIPMELEVENGEMIYLPGNSSTVIAVVNEAISESTDPFKKILLSSPVNIQNLKWVEVEREN